MKTAERSSYEHSGRNYRDLWNDNYYLGYLFFEACTETHDRTFGECDLTSVNEAREYLGEYRNPSNKSPLFTTLSKKSKIGVRYSETQFALDLRLLNSDLSDIEALPKDRLRNLRNFFMDAHFEFVLDSSTLSKIDTPISDRIY